MALYEYFPDPFDHNEEPDEEYGPIEKPTCKFCGKRSLTWGQTYKGWKLFEGYDRPHICNKTSTDDFEDLTK
jgi:hypothetical protein